MIIRRFTTDDYLSISKIHNTIYPGKATTAEAWANDDVRRNPKLEMRRWVADVDDSAVGFAGCSQQVFDYHPGKFYVTVRVLPAFRCRGIGAALYDTVIEGLQSFDLTTLRADGYANLPEGVRFIEKRGFVEVFRERPQHLDVMAFDPAPHVGLEEQLRDQGIEIKSLREMEHDPDRDRKVYALYWEAMEDVPKEHPITPMAFDEWAEWTLKDPQVVHEGYFIAVCGESYVGISEFGASGDGDVLWAGLVGVRRRFRGRGIARAMQIRAIDYARTFGHSVIKTSTSVTNRPMLALYGRLGFNAQPDWLQLEKTFDS